MAFIDNLSDFNIRWRGHPKFKTDKIIEDQAVEVIVQKLEMLLFTNRKEVIGSAGYGLGADLEYLLWETKIPNAILKQRIVKQIDTFIPELNLMGYDFDLSLYEGDYRDILSLDFVIQGYNVAFVFN
jgi:hypothetical protein